MPRRTRQTPPAPPPDHTLFDFTHEYFTQLGATVARDVPKDRSRLDVRLPADLAEHFGRETLGLSFHSAEPQSDRELIAHGSRVFDQMMVLLDRQSAFTVLRAPARHRGGETLLTAVRPVNASVGRLRLQEQSRFLFGFTWRVTYRADDKRQEIYTVWLDEEGGRIAQSGERSAAADALDLVQMMQDAAPIPPEHNADGEVLPPKLLPMTHLVRLADRARSFAVYHADVRCVNHEAEILPRLYKVLNRLTTYYQQQIDEVRDSNDPDGTRRRALEDDLQRKLAEEVENHRLRVQVELIGYVALETPIAVAEMTLTNGRHEVGVRVLQDRYSGVIQRPACYACGSETADVALDRNGHITCDACAHICATCNELVCATCGVEMCPVCGAENCGDCGRTCWACGGRACGQHISVCPTCGDAVCHSCQVECAACGVRQCRSHLRADCVVALDAPAALICPACAVRCPGCQQFSAHTGVCDASGQRFCENCLVTCRGCGRTVGPGFYHLNPVDGAPYCAACVVECPACHRVATSLLACDVCGAQGCPVCVARCVTCGRPVCEEHGVRLSGCGHVVCNRDLVSCATCDEVVCPACTSECASCGLRSCADHTTACSQCGQEYCVSCVGTGGLCETCRFVEKHGKVVAGQALPWLDHPEAGPIALHYQWRKAENLRYDIYFGEGKMASVAVVVVRHGADGGRVVRVQRMSALDRLRGMFGL